MGNYDLYGNSYKTAQEAMNAEMAQCAEIDARHAARDAERALENQQQSEHHIWQYIQMLEERISHLENITKSLNPI